MHNEAIAIVGVSALFPGSADEAGFWRDIVAGKDLITDVPARRWLIEDHYDPDPRAEDKTYCKRGAFLSPYAFDPLEFGVPPQAIPATDTCQLLSLVAARRVLDDVAKGQRGEIDRERASVILGVTSGQQLFLEVTSRLGRPMWVKALRESGIAEPQVAEISNRIAASYVPWQENTFPGLLGNVVAGRIANRFDLRGTNCVTDAACASSLAALSMAVDELRLHRSDLVITGGADTFNDVSMFVAFSKTPALSPTGDCRPFSDRADGTVLGEGIAMFALKRLADAERDGNAIYAVIRAIGSSSDGRSKSIYAPLSSGQARALRRAYEEAGYGPEAIELVEAHGTGTAAGDAAEIESLRMVFEPASNGDRQWCALGSVKSQVGHTKAAAGAAALFKTAMALHHRTLPPTIKVDRPHPALRLNESPFYVNTTARPWIPRNGGPRRAALSSFGFGGTNFHAIVEEYTGPAQPKRVWPNSAELMLLSAADAGALREACLKTAKLCEEEAAPLANLAFASQGAFDAALAYRAGAVAADHQEMSRKLRQMADGKFPPGTLSGTGAETGKIAFLFPGQGSQYAGMGAELAMTFPEAMAVWEQAPEAAAAAFPPHAFSREEEEAQSRKLRATENAQPAVGAASAASLAVLDRLGLRADCVGGHSFGEITALFAAGAIDRATMLAVARRRGELMRDAASEPAGMLSVRSDWERIREVIDGLAVAAANHNGPAQVVLSGASEPLAESERRLRVAGFAVTALPVSTAFHSPLMQPAARAFGDYLEQTAISPPRVPFYSNRDGSPHSAGVARDLAAQIAAPVFFAQMIERMYADGVRIFVEVGPRDVLTSLVGSILEGKDHRAIATDRAGAGLRALWEGLAALAVAGVSMNWTKLREHHAVSDAVSHPPEAKFSVPIDGGNYGRPYPPAGGSAALPKPILATPAVAAAPAPSGGEISGDAYRVFQESITSAHRDWQANLAKGHEAFLRSMEAALGGIGGARSAAPLSLRIEAPRIEPAPAIAAPVEILPIKVDGEAPSRTAVWEIVAEKTGYPADMLEPSMALEADLGIDSIKRVEIFSALQERFPEFAGADTAMLGALRTLDDVLHAMKGAAASPVIQQHAASSQSTVWEVVAEKTGYPADMLEAAMALEADLGIDSIKRVEIFSALQERFPAFANTDTAALGGIRTLGEIVAALDGTPTASREPSAPVVVDGTTRGVWEAVAEATGYPVEALDAAMVLEDDLAIDEIKRLEIFSALEERFTRLDTSSLAAARTLGDLVAACSISVPEGPRRSIVSRRISTRHAAPCGTSLLKSGSRVVIANDHGGVAAALAERLEQRGFHTIVGDESPHADAWICLTGLRAETGARGLHWDAIRFAKAGARAKVFVTVQDTAQPWLGGFSGLAKTAALEWPDTQVKAIRIETARRTPEAIAEALLEELLRGGADQEVELTASSRNVLETVETGWNLRGDPPPIPANPVIVATGGARGVTAACLKELAGAILPKLVLFGRTALEAESPATSACQDAPSIASALLAGFRAEGAAISPMELKDQAARILAVREVRRTIDSLERAGAQVRYFAIDARNASAVRGALTDVRREWGPIYGVVHAAGVLADKEIAALSLEQFDAVFSTKVDALRVLLEATADDPVGLLCVFSSAAARYGNRGQAAYAIANEVLNRVAEAEAQRRGSSCIVRSIDWGPWDGGMVTPELAKHFAQMHVPLIGMQEGARLFVKELLSGEAAVEVVIGNLTPPRELRVAIRQETHPHLGDHVIRDVPVLPVVEAVGLVLRAAAEQGRPPAFPCFTDVKVLRGVRLDGFHNGGNLLTVRSQGEAMFELVSADGTRHYQASLRSSAGQGAGAPDTPQHLTAHLGPLSAAPWIDDEIYGKLLFHGPEFRLIREIEGVSERGIAGTLRPRAGERWRQAVDGYDPGMLDGGLQLARLWGFFKLGQPTLPMRIGRLEILGDADGAPIQCQVSATAGVNRIVCDISFFSMKKDLLAVMTGVEMYASPEA